MTSASRTTVLRWLVPAVLALALPAAAAPAPPASSSKPSYRVFVFTKAATESHASTKDGVAAIRELGKANNFAVEASDETDKFVANQLSRYRAVVFLNTSGDVLNDAQQGAFEDYFHAGGGFVGIHSAIETEPGWQFLTDILGTRSTGASSVTPATIKVADRVHDASAPLPEYWNRTDQWYNFAADVRGFSHVLATVDENDLQRRDDGVRPPDRLVQGLQGRPLVLHGRRPHGLDVRRERLPGPPWRARSAGPRVSRIPSTATAAPPSSRTTR